jgi:hypothetical protein
MKVYPVPGRTVRDPVTNHVLTVEGLEVSEHDTFWARCLRDEDVTTTEPVQQEPAVEAAPADPHAEGDKS